MSDTIDKELQDVLGLQEDRADPVIKDDPKTGKSAKKAATSKKVAAASSEEDSWTAKEREARAKKKHKFAPGEMRYVTIQKERGKGGERPVPVTVNGITYTVPRGVKVRVPAMVAEVLKNAEEDLVEWDGVATLEHRPAQSYPHTVEMA